MVTDLPAPGKLDALRRYLVEAADLGAERRAEVQQAISDIGALLADVTVAVVPDGAPVTIDGQQVGTAPLPMQRLAAGQHVVEVSAEGYRPLRREIMVTAGVAVNLKLVLTALPHSGKVHFASQQPSSMVKIDGQVLGLTPLDTELAAGGHLLTVTAPGYQAYRSELVVVAGQSRNVDVVLDALAKKDRFYKKWWFWTIVGVAAGGAAAAIAVPLATSGTLAPLVGTLAPGAVKAN